MHAVAEHVCRALRAAEQECDDWLVSLYSVAALARQYEIVAPIVGTLAATRGHVVQGDGVLVVSEATVGADWPVLGEQPLSCLQVSASVSGEGGKLWFGVGVSTSFSAAPSTPWSWCCALVPSCLPGRSGTGGACSGFGHMVGVVVLIIPGKCNIRGRGGALGVRDSAWIQPFLPRPVHPAPASCYPSFPTAVSTASIRLRLSTRCRAAFISPWRRRSSSSGGDTFLRARRAAPVPCAGFSGALRSRPCAAHSSSMDSIHCTFSSVRLR